ncbi:MAG: RrF2 family transcriptional regulator [Rectinemataceae bacterium]
MFNVSTKTQYGIRALVHLARAGEVVGHVQGNPAATAAAIARSESISPKYLEGILSLLTTAGLLVSERGKHGGYRLARPPREVSMLEIVEALEGEIKPVDCIASSEVCAQGGSCLPRLFWLGLKESVDGYLSSRSLKDVLEGEADDGRA